METYYVVSWNKDCMDAVISGGWYSDEKTARSWMDFDDRLFVVTIDVKEDNGSAQP